jgi:hypothetical protein
VAQEFGFMAVDRSRLKARAAAGDANARRALTITKRTSFMLSGAQLGITVTGLIVGYVAEPLIGDGIGELLGGVGVPAGVGVAVGTVFALLFATVVQMVFGELFPDNPAGHMRRLGPRPVPLPGQPCPEAPYIPRASYCRSVSRVGTAIRPTKRLLRRELGLDPSAPTRRCCGWPALE